MSRLLSPISLHKELHVLYIASVPGLPRSVRVLIMSRRQTFEERGRPGRKHHVRVDAWWAWHVFSRYQAFLTLRFWQIVEVKSKMMGYWVRSRPLLPTSRMVSFSCSIIDFTYAREFAAYNRFPSGQKQLSSQSNDRQSLILRQVDSRGLDLTQQPIVLLFTSTICQKRRIKKA